MTIRARGHRHYIVSTRRKDDSAQRKRKTGRGSWKVKARKTARCRAKRRG